MKHLGKIICFSVFSVFTLFSFGQNRMVIVDENSTPVVINDTLFIKKDSLYSIFIDTTGNPVYYEKLADFSMDGYEKDSYEETLKQLKAKNGELTAWEPDEFPRKWRDLYLYNGEYYIYYPCDFCGNYRICVTDTTFIDYMCDGAVANKIQEYKKLDDSTFYFRITSPVNTNDRLLTIHLIDAARGIAVFQTDLFSGESVYNLMVDVEKLRKFPVIVNKCDQWKVLEMNFPEPDFEQLIKDMITDKEH
ncbi:MAG: hypothetical protein LBV74_13155 [Tannerella sp.]|jgi:hypothetical protein|nr:hypothetical protein [Tannerella sp.]